MPFGGDTMDPAVHWVSNAFRLGGLSAPAVTAHEKLSACNVSNAFRLGGLSAPPHDINVVGKDGNVSPMPFGWVG